MAPRAAQRQDGPGCSPASLRSKVCLARDARSRRQAGQLGSGRRLWRRCPDRRRRQSRSVTWLPRCQWEVLLVHRVVTASTAVPFATSSKSTWAERSGPSDASSSSRRTRRKKKRKKKFLKTSSGPLHRQGWRRSCALQRQVPAVHCVHSVHLRLVDIPVVLQRQVPTVPPSPSWCSSGWLCWLRCPSAVFLLVFAGQDIWHLGRLGPQGQFRPGWLCWLRCTSAVFLLVVAGQDLQHLGRYDRGMYKAGIAGDNAPRAVFVSLVGRPMMLGIMLWSRWTVATWCPCSDCSYVPVAVHGYRRPCCAGRTGSLPRRGAEAGSMVQTVHLTMDILQLLNTVADVPVVRSCNSCSPLNSGLVVACPLCATTGAEWFGVQKTAFVPQLQRSGSVSGFFFTALYTVQGRGRVHRDTVPIIRCISCGVIDKHFVVTSCVHHNHHNQVYNKACLWFVLCVALL